MMCTGLVTALCRRNSTHALEKIASDMYARGEWLDTRFDIAISHEP